VQLAHKQEYEAVKKQVMQVGPTAARAPAGASPLAACRCVPLRAACQARQAGS
jgi:hypothetical protein